MKLKQIFEKQGGANLLKQYRKGGALFTAFAEFVLLGKSRTALEILRLSANLKVKQKLEKQYKRYLDSFDEEWTVKNLDETVEHTSSNKVWVCWFQGMDEAPMIVKKCFESLKENLPEKEIVLLTKDNLDEYVTFPAYIVQKWERGVITDTHMTDLLRLELLLKYGGMWIDATVFLSSSDIPDYFFESDLFFFQSLKPGRDGQSTYISSWLMSAKTNNKILMACQRLCYKYWEQHESLIDYFLLHDFMSIVLDYYEEDWKKIVPRDNSTPHILLLRLFEQYDIDMWENIKRQTPVHKLTYKFSEEQSSVSGTYYDVIFCGGKHAVRSK